MRVSKARISTRFLSLTLSSLILVTPAWADLRDGVEAYKRGDYASALIEFHKTAEQGDSGGHYLMSVMYAEGRGISKNDENAQILWRRASEPTLSSIVFIPIASYQHAAKRGDVDAQVALAFMYWIGTQISQSYVNAYMWFSVAGTDGDIRIIDYMDMLTSQMKPDDIVAGERLSRSFEAIREKVDVEPIQISGNRPNEYLIRRIQEQLTALGYETGLIDGIAGRRTRAAVKAFQQDAGRPVDGILSDELLSVLVETVEAAADRYRTAQGFVRGE